MPDHVRHAETARTPGRALVPVVRAVPALSGRTASAGFLTQLIACDRRLPAYRAARRAEPALALSRYGAAAAAVPSTLDRNA